MSETKKLYIIEVSICMAVLAEGQDGAERTAMKHARKEIEVQEPEVNFIFEVDDLNGLDADFHDSIPWGADDDRTIRQILSTNSASPAGAESR